MAAAAREDVVAHYGLPTMTARYEALLHGLLPAEPATL